MQIGSVDSFTQQAFTESGSCVGHVCPGKVNTVSALLQLIVQWAGEGMEGDGTGSRSQLLNSRRFLGKAKKPAKGLAE